MYQLYFDDKYYTTVRKRVKNGIKLLNKKVPGWRKRVNVRTLNLADGSMCVLGQTFKKEVAVNSGELNGFAFATNGERESLFKDSESSASCGFFVPYAESDRWEDLPRELKKNAVDPWTLLGEVWKDELKKIPR